MRELDVEEGIGKAMGWGGREEEEMRRDEEVQSHWTMVLI